MSVTSLCDASEAAPDGTPGTGYFEFTRDSSLSYFGNARDPLPALTVTYAVETDATEDYPNPATPGYEYAALSGTVSFPEGATSVLVPVQPNEIDHVEGNTTVTAYLESDSGYVLGTPAAAILNIINTDADTVTVTPPVLEVDETDQIPVTVTNYYGRPAVGTEVSLSQYDPDFVTFSQTTALVDASGESYFTAEALEYGTMMGLLDAVASVSQASGPTSPVGSGSAPLRAWGIAPESVTDGVPGAELPQAVGGAQIYVPESHPDMPGSQSAASYWAPFIVHVTSPYPLTFNVPKGWQINSQGDGLGVAIVSGDPYDVSNGQVLYVEATSVLNDAILTVTNTTLSAAPFDRLKVTSFKLLGPNDVPQFGTYEYTTSFPGATPVSAGWEIATGGAMAVRVLPKPNPSDAFVTWGAGPLVGTAIYDVTPNFSWPLNVNIVQVSVTTPTSVPAFVPGTATQQNAQVANTILVSSDHLANAGLTWNASVTFTGPNGNQGVSHIMAGFVQNLKVTSFSGTYGPAPFLIATPYFGGTTMVGATFWDHRNEGSGKFYDPKAYSPAFVYGKDQLANPAHVFLITSSDSPGAGPPVIHLSKQVSAMGLIWDFNLFVAATTDEASNVYAGQALATWRFNASGNINASKIWTSSAPKIPGTLIPQIITPPTQWVPLTSNSTQPVVDTVPFNGIIQAPNFADRWR